MTSESFVLPALAYAPSSLEPHVDARTMTLHHDFHHASYVKALNLAMQGAPASLQGKSVHWLLQHLAEVPTAIRTAVRNNAGGHANHSLLWESMAPDGGGSPRGLVADAINQAFGSFAEFQSRFEAAGAAQFGSGWVWLVATPGGEAPVRIVTTAGHDSPVTEGHWPLLVNDVWEHAYYLKHENRRPDYLRSWWSVVNWLGVAHRLANVPSVEFRPVPGRQAEAPPSPTADGVTPPGTVID